MGPTLVAARSRYNLPVIAPRYTTSDILLRFFVKKVLWFAVICALSVVVGFKASPLGWIWWAGIFAFWCLLDVAELSGDVQANNDLHRELQSGGDPEKLRSHWQERDKLYGRIDGAVVIAIGIFLYLLNYHVAIALIAAGFGALNLLAPGIFTEDRDIEQMVTQKLPDDHGTTDRS